MKFRFQTVKFKKYKILYFIMISQTEFNTLDAIALFPRTIEEIVLASKISRATVISNLKDLKLKNLVKRVKYGPKKPGRKEFYYSLTKLGREVLRTLYKVELEFIQNVLDQKGIEFTFGPSMSTWIKTRKLIPRKIDLLVRKEQEERCKKILKRFSNIKIMAVSELNRVFYQGYPLLSEQGMKELGTRRQVKLYA